MIHITNLYEQIMKILFLHVQSNSHCEEIFKFTKQSMH